MRRYLLDTCALIWVFQNNKRIGDIAEDIEYFQGDYAVSVDSVKELLYLLQSGKLRMDFSFETMMTTLQKKNISVYAFDQGALKALSELPFFKSHPDPTDRCIIAMAISDNRTLITGDRKFIQYPKLKILLI